MWTWGIVAVLCCALGGQFVLFRRSKRALTARCAHQEAALADLAAQLKVQEDRCTRLAEDRQALTAALEGKTAEIARLSAPPRQKLYLPDSEEPPQEPPRKAFGRYTVYFNENTGIYHADRACAPYQAIEAHLYKVMDHARPCKKCAEGLFPFPEIPEPPREDPPSDQMSLFDSGDDQ